MLYLGIEVDVRVDWFCRCLECFVGDRGCNRLSRLVAKRTKLTIDDLDLLFLLVFFPLVDMLDATTHPSRDDA